MTARVLDGTKIRDRVFAELVTGDEKLANARPPTSRSNGSGPFRFSFPH